MQQAVWQKYKVKKMLPSSIWNVVQVQEPIVMLKCVYIWATVAEKERERERERKRDRRDTAVNGLDPHTHNCISVSEKELTMLKVRASPI